MIEPHVYSYRGVYGVYSDNQELMYIGSTHLGLKVIEENHRNARQKQYTMTTFRLMLEQNPQWVFVWLVKPLKCQQPHIEFTEQMLIEAMKPRYNIDKTPYKTSLAYMRYGDALRLYGAST